MDLMLLYDITPAEKVSLDLNKLVEKKFYLFESTLRNMDSHQKCRRLFKKSMLYMFCVNTMYLSGQNV